MSSDTGAYSPLSSQSDGGASSSSAGNGSSASNQGSTSQGSQGAAQPPASTCTISIDCQAALDNRDQLSSGILQSLPSNGVILAASSIELAEGESAFDVLKNACEKAGITLDYTGGFLGSSVYVRSIGPIGEFDCGPQSGWTYTVNGQMVFTSASDYMIQPGDTLSWSYTCSA